MSLLVYVALARRSEDAGFTCEFPDFPGLGASAPSMGELLPAARDALLAHLQRLADEAQEWPAATSLDHAPAEPGRFPFLVDVSVDDTPVRVNISIGERLLRQIDQAAQGSGMSRSGFIAQAARQALEGRSARAGDFDAVARRLQEEVSGLGRKITESLGPDSTFTKHVSELDTRIGETLRRAAEGLSAAVARRREGKAAGHGAETGPGAEEAPPAAAAPEGPAPETGRS